MVKSETSQTEITKSEPAVLETTKPEKAPKTEPVQSEIDKSEEPKKSETDKPKSETDQLEDTNSEIVKSESGTEETIQVEEKAETTEPITSDKSESIGTDIDMADKSQEVENDTAENVETPSDKKTEPMDVDSEEIKKPETPNENNEQEVQPAEQSNDKLSETAEQVDGNKPENVEIENKETDAKEKDEPRTDEIDITPITDNIEPKTESSSKEVKSTTSEIPPDTITKTEPKVVEQIAKSKECPTSVESVDRLKAMFPELEVVHKDLSAPTVEKLPVHKPLQQIDQTIAHLLATSYQNPIKWPKVKLSMPS